MHQSEVLRTAPLVTHSLKHVGKAHAIIELSEKFGQLRGRILLLDFLLPLFADFSLGPFSVKLLARVRVVLVYTEEKFFRICNRNCHSVTIIFGLTPSSKTSLSRGLLTKPDSVLIRRFPLVGEEHEMHLGFCFYYRWRWLGFILRWLVVFLLRLLIRFDRLLFLIIFFYHLDVGLFDSNFLFSNHHGLLLDNTLFELQSVANTAYSSL